MSIEMRYGIPFFNGLRVSISQPYQKANVQLSQNVTVSDEFRKTMNEWCLEFFGWEYGELVTDGQVIKAGEVLVMNQKTFDLLKAELAKSYFQPTAPVLRGM
jgi:hypothetical protein